MDKKLTKTMLWFSIGAVTVGGVTEAKGHYECEHSWLARCEARDLSDNSENPFPAQQYREPLRLTTTSTSPSFDASTFASIFHRPKSG
jgi:hypothetical protein